MLQRRDLVGPACAAFGALSYAVTIIIGRRLAGAGFGSSISLGIRFGIAGAILVAVVIAARRPLLPAPGERLAALGLGAAGYAVESTFFFLALSEGTAAAVALLFYAYPAMVTMLAIPLTGARPSRRGIAALCLSVTGAAVIAVAGGRVDISGAGIAFALGSAATFAVYLLAAERLLRRTDSLTSGAYVAVGAAVALLARSGVGGAVDVPAGYWLDLVGYGAATAAAFVLMFAAVRRIGSARTAVVMTLEAFFAIVLAAIFLGERLGPAEIIGGVAILAGATLIGLSPPVRPGVPSSRRETPEEPAITP